MKTIKTKTQILPWLIMGLMIVVTNGCDPREKEGEDGDDEELPKVTSWVKHADCILAGTVGSWDEDGIIGPTVLVVDNVYHMWYSGMKEDDQTTLFAIGHATSADGLSWTKDPSNPVLEKGSAGSWDETWVYFPQVVKVGSTYHMWYTGRGPYNNSIIERGGYATSPDGVTWTKHPGNPVLTPGSSGQWDMALVVPGPVLYRDDKFHMWYTGSIDGYLFSAGYATSVDGTNWTRHPGNPVMDNGGNGKWDWPRTQTESIIFNGTAYEMWYSGGLFGYWRIGHATSPDGITWTRDPLNPVLEPGTGWDKLFVAFPSVLTGTGTKLRMWFTSTTNTISSGAGIGYAEKQ